MDKILTIDGREVGFRATALTPRLYRHQIGRDIIRDLNQLRTAFAKVARAATLPEPGVDTTAEEMVAYKLARQEAQLSVLDLEIFENAAYVMAKQYDPSLPDTAEGWLDGFETFSIYEILPQILELWRLNGHTTSVPKKK